MKVRQSTLKLWMDCPLKVYYQEIQGIDREISGNIVFGWIIHDCVMWMEVHQDLEGAQERFRERWIAPYNFDPEWRITYYVRGSNWKKFYELGPEILEKWWRLIQWETDHVLAREYSFEVPIGKKGNVLTGTIDKLVLRYMPQEDRQVVLVSDYKTNKRQPTYGYLHQDVQFSAYGYATLQPEFWVNIPRGQELYEEYLDTPRYAEWVQLQEGKRVDAGIREEYHYARLEQAVDAMADSIEMRIFVPNLLGDSCLYCDYRAPCGLPEVDLPEF